MGVVLEQDHSVLLDEGECFFLYLSTHCHAVSRKSNYLDLNAMDILEGKHTVLPTTLEALGFC